MGIEIERKFLVGGQWPSPDKTTAIAQAYVQSSTDVNVRIRKQDDAYFLTIKAKRRDAGAGRYEFEYPIPEDDGECLLKNVCTSSRIEKTRHHISLDDVVWEVDVFHGENEGLILAEVELVAERQAITLPPWIGPEVSDDPRFTNAYLAGHPFQSWGVRYEALCRSFATAGS